MKVVLRQGGAHLLTLITLGRERERERKVFALVTSLDLKNSKVVALCCPLCSTAVER